MSDQPPTPNPNPAGPTGPQPPTPPPGPPGHPGAGPAPGVQPGPEPAREHPRRSRLAAGVVAAAVVLGGAAGFGGAALWDAVDDDSTSSASDSGSRDSASSDDSGSDDVADTDSGSAVERAARKVLPSVVKIDVAGGQGQGSGSGIVLTEDGQILTNNHVVEVAGNGGTISVSFDDGTRAAAEIVGTDSLTDLAVIQAQDVEGLTPATTGNSMDLSVGETVVAVGSPYGLDATVTSGIVSALNRPVDVGQDTAGNTTAYPAIQTDAAINPGNSGGPLVDLAGHVVGINSSILSTSSGSGQSGEAGSIGLGFAIPIDAALPIVEEIVDGKTPTHARLGITVSDPPTGDSVEGALVRDVGGRSAAARAGLQAGDVITRVDDHPVTGAASLIATIRSYRPGDTVEVTYQRDGEERTAQLELGSDAETD